MRSASSNAHASTPVGPAIIQGRSDFCRLARNGPATASARDETRRAPPIRRKPRNASDRRDDRTAPTEPMTNSAIPRPIPQAEIPPSSLPSIEAPDGCKITHSPIPRGTPSGNFVERLGGSRVIVEQDTHPSRVFGLGRQGCELEAQVLEHRPDRSARSRGRQSTPSVKKTCRSRLSMRPSALRSAR